jgi:hypothetical protein
MVEIVAINLVDCDFEMLTFKIPGAYAYILQEFVPYKFLKEYNTPTRIVTLKLSSGKTAESLYVAHYL